MLRREPGHPRQPVEPLPPAHHQHRLPQAGTPAAAVPGDVLPGPDDPTYPRRFDLLIVDEAHNCAPSGPWASTPPTRSGPRPCGCSPALSSTSSSSPPRRTTATRRAFSALLELLDNQRFARGTPPDRKQLEGGDGASAEDRRASAGSGTGRPGSRSGSWSRFEVAYTEEERAVHAALRRYTKLRGERKPKDKAEKFATEFVLKTLKKRLFSCPAAFADDTRPAREVAPTAKAGRRPLRKPTVGIFQQELDRVDEDYADDGEYDEATDDAVDAASRLFSEPSKRTKRPPSSKQMKEWAEKAAAQLDSKARAADRLARPSTLRPGKKWGHERVIIFTEYRATQNWLL